MPFTGLRFLTARDGFEVETVIPYDGGVVALGHIDGITCSAVEIAVAVVLLLRGIVDGNKSIVIKTLMKAFCKLTATYFLCSTLVEERKNKGMVAVRCRYHFVTHFKSPLCF